MEDRAIGNAVLNEDCCLQDGCLLVSAGGGGEATEGGQGLGGARACFSENGLFLSTAQL